MKEIRTETQIISRTEQFNIMFRQSKALYNVANYIKRQNFDYYYWNKKPIEEYNERYRDHFKDRDKDETKKKMLDYFDLVKICYSKLPSHTFQQILRLLDKDWKSFFSLKWIQENRKPPWYKHKEFLLIFTKQNIQKDKNSNDIILKKKILNYKIKTKQDFNAIKMIRIRPYWKYHMKIEVIYEVEKEELTEKKIRKWKKAWLDIWLNNICSIVTSEWKTYIINWKQIKSINSYFNMLLAYVQSKAKTKSKNKPYNESQFPLNKVRNISKKRTRKIDYYLHQVSKLVVEFLEEEWVTELVIWKNIWWKEWKWWSNLKDFIQIPFNRLIEMIIYKFNWKVHIVEESYTSKIDHLAKEKLKKIEKLEKENKEEVNKEDKDNKDTKKKEDTKKRKTKKKEEYLWKRVKRWLFRSSIWKVINADINWAIWIMRKQFWDIYLDTIIQSHDIYYPNKKINLAKTSSKSDY